MSLPIPNFLIIGAQKSGTTSLHAYLKAHPDIFMSSPIKEPGYFLPEETIPAFWRRRGLEIASSEELLSMHMLRGYKGQPHFGESSTYYTIGRRSQRERIPERIVGVNPGMKFLYVLRDPIDRIRSNYLHSVQRGAAKGTLEEFLGTINGRMAVLTSLYFHQLQPYLACFPADQFHVVIFEEFLRSPREHMDAIYRFLGARPFEGAVRYDAHNVSGNREQISASEGFDFQPARLAALQARYREEKRKLCEWLRRDDILDWSNLL